MLALVSRELTRDGGRPCPSPGANAPAGRGAANAQHGQAPSQTAMLAATLRRATFPAQPRNPIAGMIRSQPSRLIWSRMPRALVDAATVNGTKHRTSEQAGIAAMRPLYRRTTFS